MLCLACIARDAEVQAQRGGARLDQSIEVIGARRAQLLQAWILLVLELAALPT
jgi:hypothetical protein